jgi:hypothetical protein
MMQKRCFTVEPVLWLLASGQIVLGSRRKYYLAIAADNGANFSFVRRAIKTEKGTLIIFYFAQKTEKGTLIIFYFARRPSHAKVSISV